MSNYCCSERSLRTVLQRRGCSVEAAVSAESEAKIGNMKMHAAFLSVRFSVLTGKTIRTTPQRRVATGN